MDKDSLEFKEMVQAKRISRMEAIDAHPPAIRDLIHEYGFSVVYALLNVGVTKPKRIRHVVETILDEFSPTRGSYSQQGVRTQVIRPPAAL